MVSSITSTATVRRLFLIYIIVAGITVYSSNTVWGVTSPLGEGLGPMPNERLADALDAADQDSHKMASRITPLPMEYCIFQGVSSIRDISENDKHLVDPNVLFGGCVSGTDADCPREEYADAQRCACAMLLLLRGYLDAAHDVILGVTLDNVEEGEYAALHRGETNWMQEHPLSDSADLIHAAIHRLEGSALGEGDYMGYENSKYWLAGGPKALERPAMHSVRTDLARIARECAPCSVERGVIAGENGAKHSIIADGGKTRNVCVPAGQWDGFAFVDLCERRECGHELSQELVDEVTMLERAELVLLLRSQLEECLPR
jgi:hypothetical protein